MGIGAIGRAFVKIGEGFLDLIRDPVVLKGLKIVVARIPVAGPAIAIALELVSQAERTFPEAGSGTVKLAWVLQSIDAALAEAGIEEKRVRALIEIALLILENEGELVPDGLEG